MTSAGDHERMPDKEDAQDVEDLTDGHINNKEKRKAIKKLRDSVGVAQKSSVIERMKSMTPQEYEESLKARSGKASPSPSTPSSPVKAKRGKNLTLPDNATSAGSSPVKTRGNNKPNSNASSNFLSDIVKMSQSNSGINLDNKLKKKLRK